MTLKPPFIITSRLLPGLKIGDGVVQLEYSTRPGNQGRTRYKWTIDVGAESFSGDDLQSGCGGGDLQEGFESLLSFLGAFAEAWRHGGKEGENADLFPEGLKGWACDNSDELATLRFDIEEAEDPLIEE